MTDDKLVARFTRAFSAAVPHNVALGIEILDMEKSGTKFRLPYNEKLVGNPDTGVLHGGAITALLDACSGAAVFAALTELVPIATLDLRIDYLRPAEAGHDVICTATCYKVTKNVAFTRAVAYHERPDRSASSALGPDQPIASSVGTFMIATKGKP